MRARLTMLWAGARDSLWLMPTLFTAVGALLAFGTVQLDQLGVWRSLPGRGWLFGGGAEGARGVLTAIAGSLITVTGVIFSVTIVALQLASSQFTPRVLRRFTADRANQIVLGVLIGTFTYTLLVLRTVTSDGQARDAFVPVIGVTLAVVLSVVSIGALIFFIHHAARSIQVSVILERETRQTLHQIERLFPERRGRTAAPEDIDLSAPPPEPAMAITATRGGYVQAIRVEDLLSLGDDRRLTVRMERKTGDYLFEGETLAVVWPAGAANDAVVEAVRGAFALGSERTPEQDVEYGIIGVSDIAVRALSPGINDPTTALLCINRLGEMLVALGQRCPASPLQSGNDGRVRVLVRHTTFERAVGLAFDQIEHFGASNPAIVKRLVDVLARIALLVPEELRPTLDKRRDSVLAAGRRDLDATADRPGFELVAAQTAVGGGRAPSAGHGPAAERGRNPAATPGG